MSINPLERRGCEEPTSPYRCDLLLAVSIPEVSDLSPITVVPNDIDPVSLTFEVSVDPTQTLGKAFCEYYTSEDITPQTVDAVPSGNGHQCVIPPQADGLFVRVRGAGTDSRGATAFSETLTYRSLADGIDTISDLQLTFDELPGDSPFAGGSWTMGVTATVMSSPDLSGLIVLQDNPFLAPWSGIIMDEESSSLRLGDEIHITFGEIIEAGSLTTIINPVYEVISSGNTVQYKEMITSDMFDPSIVESHEGMMVRFVDIAIGVNPDMPMDFGEWTFKSQSTLSSFIRADDLSDAIPEDYNATLFEESVWDFIQGVWWFSSGDYKLIPENPDTDLIPEGSSVPPTFVSSPASEALLCSDYSSSIGATSIPRSNFSLVDAPAGMTIKGLSGDINWFPSTPGTYEISIKADNGLSEETEAFSIFVDSIRFELSVDEAFQDAEKSSSYKLLSLPGSSNLPVAETFSGTAGQDWFVFRDNGILSADSSTYLEAYDMSLPEVYSFTPGRGFWGLSATNWQVPTTQSTLPIEPSCIHTIELKEGWNTIGNPFNRDIPWANIQQLNELYLLNSPLWSFEDGLGRWQADTTLAPYKGYYFYTSSPLSLKIPYLDTGADSPPPSPDEYISMHAVLEKDTLSTTRVDFNENVSADLDALDRFAPRNAFQPVSMQFLLEEDPNRGLYSESRSYLPDGQRLLLNVHNATTDTAYVELGDVTLSSEPGILLVDPELDAVYNLSDNPQTRVPQLPGSKNYFLIVGDNPVSSQTDEYPLSAQVTLSQNYPNPFKANTTIDYSLPRAEWVRLEVYDVLGRKVDTLVDAFQEAGPHSAVWDGSLNIASGVYVYRLRTSSRVLSRTMLISR